MVVVTVAGILEHLVFTAGSIAYCSFSVNFTLLSTPVLRSFCDGVSISLGTIQEFSGINH